LEAGGSNATETMERLGRTAATRELSVRQVEQLVRQERERGATPAATAEAPPKTASARDLETRLSRSLGTRVRVVEAGAGRGRLDIHDASLDQLAGNLARLLS